MSRKCIKPEDLNQRFFGESFEQIAKDNKLVKIGKYYYCQSGRKTEKKEEEVKKEGFFDKK